MIALGGSTVAAHAETAAFPLFVEDESQLRAFFTTFSVASSVQDKLIEDWESEGSWDSISSMADPVSVAPMSVDGVEWSVATYADGSIAASGIGGETSPEQSAQARTSEESGTVGARSIDECGYSEGATGNFVNCKAYYWVGAISGFFRVNFSINGNGNDSINEVWEGSLTAIPSCGVSIPEPVKVKAVESSTGPAIAGHTPSATQCGTNYTTSFPNYIHVGGNVATHHFG